MDHSVVDSALIRLLCSRFFAEATGLTKDSEMLMGLAQDFSEGRKNHAIVKANADKVRTTDNNHDER